MATLLWYRLTWSTWKMAVKMERVM